MKPRTRAERQREAAAQAAVAGPQADEAIQRDWANARQQKEHDKVVERLQEKQDSLRQLEIAAQEDTDLRRQVILQRAELELDQLKHNVQLPQAGGGAAGSRKGGAGAAEKEPGSMPLPAAFAVAGEQPVSPKTRAKAGLFDQAPAGAIPTSNQSLFGAPSSYVSRAEPRPGGYSQPPHAAAADAAAGAPLPSASALANPDPTLLPGGAEPVPQQYQSVCHQAMSPVAAQASPIAVQVPVAAPLPPPPAPPLGAGDAGAGCNAARRDESYQLRRDEFMRRRQQQAGNSQSHADPQVVSEPSGLPSPRGPALAQQYQPPHPAVGSQLPVWQPFGPPAAAAEVGPVAMGPGCPQQVHIPYGPPHQAGVSAAPSPPLAPQQCGYVHGGYVPSAPAGVASPCGAQAGISAAPPPPLCAQQGGYVQGGYVPSAPARLATPCGAGPVDPTKDAAAAMDAKKAYGEELRRQADLDRERKKQGKLAEKIGSPPRQARSLPSDAPVEPRWSIACNGQQMMPQEPQPPQWQPLGPPAAGGALQQPAGHAPWQPAIPLSQQLSPPPPHLPMQPANPYQEQQPCPCMPPQQPRGVMQPPPGYSGRTPRGQPEEVDSGGGFLQGLGQAEDASKERRRRQQEEYRSFLDQQQRAKSPALHGAADRRRASVQQPEPDSGGQRFAIGQGGAEANDRRKRQEEMRKALAEQVAEKEQQKQLEKQRREQEEIREMERLRREAEDEKRRFEEEKAREAQKKRAFLQDGQEAAARKAAEREAQTQAAKAEAEVGVQAFPPKTASNPSDGSGTPAGSRQPHQHHGRHAHGRRRGRTSAQTPDHSQSEQESVPPFAEPVGPRSDLFGCPQPFGAPAPFMAAPPPQKPLVQPGPAASDAPHELLKGVVQQQQELYRQQQESLTRLQEEAEQLKRDKETAQQNLLDLKEKQVEEKEREVRKLQKKLQRHLVLNGAGDVPGGNLSEKIDVLLAGADSTAGVAGGAERPSRLGSAAPEGIGIAGERAAMGNFWSKYEDTEPSRLPGIAAADDSDDAEPSLAQQLPLSAGPPPFDASNLGQSQAEEMQSQWEQPQAEPAVWESSPGPLAKSGGWSEAPLPWLQEDDGNEDSLPGHAVPADIRPLGSLGSMRSFKQAADPTAAGSHLPEKALAKDGAGMEDSLFEDSWGSPLTGGAGEEPAQVDPSEASLRAPAASTIGRTLVGESKLVRADSRDQTWKDVGLGHNHAAYQASWKQASRFDASNFTSKSLSKAMSPRPPLPNESIGQWASQGSSDPVANLEAAVRAIREVNGNAGDFQASLSLGHDFERAIAEAEREVSALRSEPDTVNFSDGALLRDGLSLRSAAPSTSKLNESNLGGSVCGAALPSRPRQQAAVADSTSWGGMLQKFGGHFPPGSDAGDTLNSGKASARLPPKMELSGHSMGDEFGGFDGTAPQRRYSLGDATNRLSPENAAHHGGRGFSERSLGKGAAGHAQQPSSLLKTEDFALLAAADQEDFDAFLSRLQRNAAQEGSRGGSAPPKTPPDLPRPKASAGDPLSAVPGQPQLPKERARAGSPVLRGAGSSVLRSSSLDSRPGSGGSAAGACAGTNSWNLPPSLSSSVLQR